MALKVAIVGLSPASRHLTPWGQPDWEVWGLPWDAEFGCRFHRAFEIHDKEEVQAWSTPERLAACATVYMQDVFPEVPNSVRYPLEDVQAVTGDYFQSSIAYLMALAIYEGAHEIGLYGVSMASDEEYGYQKPNMEYLIGLARGKGIVVHIPDSSPLCKYKPVFGYAERYGWLT